MPPPFKTRTVKNKAGAENVQRDLSVEDVEAVLATLSDKVARLQKDVCTLKVSDSSEEALSDAGYATVQRNNLQQYEDEYEKPLLGDEEEVEDGDGVPYWCDHHIICNKKLTEAPQRQERRQGTPAKREKESSREQNENFSRGQNSIATLTLLQPASSPPSTRSPVHSSRASSSRAAAGDETVSQRRRDYRKNTRRYSVLEDDDPTLHDDNRDNRRRKKVMEKRKTIGVKNSRGIQCRDCHSSDSNQTVSTKRYIVEIVIKCACQNISQPTTPHTVYPEKVDKVVLKSKSPPRTLLVDPKNKKKKSLKEKVPQSTVDVFDDSAKDKSSWWRRGSKTKPNLRDSKDSTNKVVKELKKSEVRLKKGKIKIAKDQSKDNIAVSQKNSDKTAKKKNISFFGPKNQMDDEKSKSSVSSSKTKKSKFSCKNLFRRKKKPKTAKDKKNK